METTMELPEHVTICEVGTRDGFQIEPDFVSTEAKIEVVNLLSDAGVPRIEVTSFVHPKVVPQMRDAEEVIAKIHARVHRTQRTLVVRHQRRVARARPAADLRYDLLGVAHLGDHLGVDERGDLDPGHAR